MPDAEPNLAPVLDRNIRALWQRREAEARGAAWQERVADVLTRFTGSMAFVGIHIVAFGLWIVANLGWLPPVPVWDPLFAVLAMVASVEAIFLSTFVLITQNRMAHASEILDRIVEQRLRYVEVPVTIRYAAETTAKGQSSWNAVAIVIQYFFGRLVR